MTKRPTNDLSTQRSEPEISSGEEREQLSQEINRLRAEKKTLLTKITTLNRLTSLDDQAIALATKKRRRVTLKSTALIRTLYRRAKRALMRHLRRAAHPGSRPALCHSLPAQSALRTADPQTAPRLATIISAELYTCLLPDAICTALRPSSLEEDLHRAKPDFVLIESTVTDSTGEWTTQLMDAAAAGPFTQLTTACRREKIPMVFWATCDAVDVALYKDAAAGCDLVYATENTVIAELAQHKAPVLAKLLSWAVQPSLHHPIRSGETDRYRLRRQACLIDGWADLLEHPSTVIALTDVISPTHCAVVESRYLLMENKRADLPLIKDAVLGCVSYEELLEGYRQHQVVLLPFPSLSASGFRKKRAMEAVCCGAAVVVDPHSQLTELLELAPQAVQAAEIGDMANAVTELMQSPDQVAKATHRARRFLHERHTYRHRLECILNDLQQPRDLVQEPLASVIMPTKRPEYVDSAIKSFLSQTYPMKELVLIYNGSSRVVFNDILQAISKLDRVAAYHLHPTNNIGVCLNFGIRKSAGPLWLKMDDDDIYAPHYLGDMVLNWQASGADTVGKVPAYIYFEEDGALFSRNAASGGFSMNAKVHLCGATLAGTQKTNRAFPFSHIRRAAVDSDFVDRVRHSQLKVLATDIYNFIAVRKSDTTQHTWRIANATLQRRAQPITTRQGVSAAIV